ncbi:hypothetical protein [Porphyrobacter sp. YT40]|uniref:hypothetical protein n=1 Tax=Porphyrobacter sp. YT40 TaxID=2547601 RepID=UPI0015E8ABE9|nr:hypothetical protein [Porphyrobacter sp. YT40]
MSPVEKGMLAILVPAVTAIDAHFGLAMALGLLGGWFARVGVSVQSRKVWPEIRREVIVMLLFSVGSVITTLFFADLLGAGPLGVAGIGFAVAFMGEKAFDILRQFILAPVLAAIKNTGEKT